MSATELARDIKRQRLSPVDVIDATFERIDQHDGKINAFVHTREEAARQEAYEAERVVQNGEILGPLHGVPIALKDLDTEMAGLPCTYGSKPFADFVPESTSAIVHRLLEAGAIVVGSTNTPEFGHKGITDNRLFGPTGTPFDPSRTAGGSSGGSAAAVAAGMVPLALGSDAGGSIRIPAAACGTYGLKPTFGLVPMDSRPDAMEAYAPFTNLGAITRTVEDTALFLDVAAGSHPRDPFSIPDEHMDYLESVRRPVSDLKVAYSPDLGLFPLEDGVRDRVDSVAETLEQIGASLERTDPALPDYDELLSAELVGFETLMASIAETQKQDGIDLLADYRGELTPKVVELIENGYEYSSVEYKQADVTRSRAYDAIEDLLEEYDILLSATLTCTPPDAEGLGPDEVAGTPIEHFLDWFLTWPMNLTGQPAASVPAGLADDGLPVGAQLIGSRLDDETVLAASAAIERKASWSETYSAI